jgi:hypothetical protein
MSAAEVIAEIETLPPAERAAVVEEALRSLGLSDKTIERRLRRLAHPEVPASFWNGVEDMEDGRSVDMETALYETPPPHILNRENRP